MKKQKDDGQHLIVAYLMVHTRMDEIGSRTTAWMIKPDECAALPERTSRLPSEVSER